MPRQLVSTTPAPRLFAVIALSAIGFATAANAPAAEAPNAMQIVVGSGPVAGMYHLPAKRVLCVSTANGIAASFKYFTVPDKNKPGVSMRVHDAKAISEAQLIVDNPTESGPKRGSLELTFGNRGEHEVKYLVSVPGGGTLTQAPAGSGLAFALKGRTKDGIGIDASAVCRDTMKV